jgi:hypothetical protein
MKVSIGGIALTKLVEDMIVLQFVDCLFEVVRQVLLDYVACQIVRIVVMSFN